MNTNKIIFAVLGGVIVLLVIMLVIQLNRDTQPSQTIQQSGDFSIWLLDIEEGRFSSIINDFKDQYPEFNRVDISVQSFSDRSIYYDTLISAIGSGIAPDIFLVNNKEYSPVLKHTVGVNPDTLSPVDFRRDFLPVFGEDLISQESDGGPDFVRGVPVSFQVPALVYDRRSFPRTSELRDWGRFELEMNTSYERANIPPLAIGDGTTVSRAETIFLAFLTQEGITDISEVQNSHTRQAFAQYRSAGEIGINSYMSLAESNGRLSDIDHFIERNVSSLLIYPKDLQTIQQSNYNLNMMFATPFPLSEGKSSTIAIDYDYFTIHQNTANYNIAENFLSYLASERGQRKYLEQFPYNLSAHSALAVELENQNIDQSLNITYGNFLDSQTELVSFQVGRNTLFGQGLRDILERENGFDSSFQLLKSYITCGLSKYRDFENLSRSCER